MAGTMALPRRGGGGAEGDRTPDLLIANEALSQLSYGPKAATGRTRCLGSGHLGLPPCAVNKGGLGRDGHVDGRLPGRLSSFQPPRRRPFVQRPAEGGLMATNPFLWLVTTVIWTYIYILIAAVIMSWLVAFNVVNTRHQFVGMVADFLYRVTEPALRPIRRRMPNLGGIDLSPAILIIGLMFFEQLVYWLYVKAFR